MDFFNGLSSLAGSAVDYFTGGGSQAGAGHGDPSDAAPAPVMGSASVSAGARAQAGQMFAGMYDALPGGISSKDLGTGMTATGGVQENTGPSGEGGYSARFDVQAPNGDPNLPKQLTGPGGRADVGYYVDSNGQGQEGANIQVQTLNYNDGFDIPGGGKRNTHIGFEVGGPNAFARSQGNENTLEAGAEANLGGIAVSSTTTDPDSDTDESSRLGLSAGMGADFRLHYGDADGDGNREYGFGFDAGPIMFDVKSEDPVRKALSMGTMGLSDMLDGGDPAKRPNLTKEVRDELSKAPEKIAELAEKAPEVLAETVETVKEMPAAVIDTVEKAPAAIAETLSDVGSGISSGIGAVGGLLGL